MAKTQTTTKNVCADIFYSIQWANALKTASLAASAWTVVSGAVTLSTDTFSGSIAVIKVAGGVANNIAIIENTVTSAEGATDCMRICITIAE